MLWNAIKIFGVVGFLICLILMQSPFVGERDIKKYDPSFRTLDMRLSYDSATVKVVLEKLSTPGRTAYQRFLLLDFAFIPCFLITMLAISQAVASNKQLFLLLLVTASLRCIFDILENINILVMLHQFPVFHEKIASLSSIFTSAKFSMLGLWIILVLSQIIIKIVERLKT